ncbi:MULTISPECIES: toll/interleukin-1 receptor domain-containing protein [unclassified Leifsonia]|uniref:toll/interleukin-1 receptor domain-containing protein n=1 Tax=unclassified Leifsonia TaxID=2663824 RepID=UPI0008A75666|nr:MULTISPECIES: toll/interleukin-1 receptor domain-containing protein [unclassified Leifsonia]SEI17122.1 TIR domain-containing protein [Leifsonia sp. CL154]SFM09264.1 TIR domain-containing protein [Leifsonia sp. CL147]
MKAGERIPLIKAAADALLAQFDDALLVLGQFGIDTEGWSWYDSDDSRRKFLLGTIQTATDTQLIDLHDFLIGSDQAPVSVSADDDPWTELPIRVFLSHKWEDAEWVTALRSNLAKYGISAFVAHKDITPSKHWREVIKAGLRSCHMMVAVLHDDFHTSQWCDQEVGWALGRGIPIATVRRTLEFDRGEDGFLEEVQDIQLDPGKASGEMRAAQEIFRAAIRTVKPPELVRRAIAEALVTSPSFENSRNLFPAIQRQDQWEQESLDRLKYAVQTNRQVYEARVTDQPLPALIQDIVDQYEPKPTVWTTEETPF